MTVGPTVQRHSAVLSLLRNAHVDISVFGERLAREQRPCVSDEVTSFECARIQM